MGSFREQPPLPLEDRPSHTKHGATLPVEFMASSLDTTASFLSVPTLQIPYLPQPGALEPLLLSPLPLCSKPVKPLTLMRLPWVHVGVCWTIILRDLNCYCRCRGFWSLCFQSPWGGRASFLPWDLSKSALTAYQSLIWHQKCSFPSYCFLFAFFLSLSFPLSFFPSSPSLLFEFYCIIPEKNPGLYWTDPLCDLGLGKVS